MSAARSWPGGFDAGWVVDGVNIGIATGGPNGGDLRGPDIAMVGNDAGRAAVLGGIPPTLRQGPIKQSARKRRGDAAENIDETVVEARYECPVRRKTTVREDTDDGVDKRLAFLPVNLELEIERQPQSRGLGEPLGKGGDPFASEFGREPAAGIESFEVRDRAVGKPAAPVGAPLECVIVEQDGGPVAEQRYVDLDPGYTEPR